MFPRRASAAVRVGGVLVGGSAPIVVQSMTNTDTADIDATFTQVRDLARAGSELVRVTVNTVEAAAAVPQVRERLLAVGVNVPLIGDFHFNGHKLLREQPACAAALDKYRINPGNVGRGSKRDCSSRDDRDCLPRSQAGAHRRQLGSLDQDLLARLMDENSAAPVPASAQAVMREAIVRSALDSAQLAENVGLPHERIILSAKVSGVQDLIAVYRSLAGRCDYALHLGLTEAGMAPRASSPPLPAWAYCSRKASATPSACRSRPSRTATARRR